MNNGSTRVHVWFPGAGEFKGGLQVYAQDVLEKLLDNREEIELSVFLKNNRQLPDFLKEAGGRGRAFGHLSGMLRTVVWGGALLIAALFQRPNVILVGHVHFAPLAAFLRRACGIRYVILTYGIESWEMTSAQIKALAQASHIFSISSYTREKLVRQGINDENVFSLPCTANPIRFAPEPRSERLVAKWNIPHDAQILLTVARLDSPERRKGYDEILEVLPKILEQFPNTFYLLVGDGEDRPRVMELIKSKSLSHHVRATGFVPEEELSEYYQLCDVFVMPSSNEGFGIVFLEALLCGKPIVCGQDGARDLIEEGQNGFAVSSDDPGQLEQALVLILSEPTRFSANSIRKSAIVRFGPERFSEAVAQLAVALKGADL